VNETIVNTIVVVCLSYIAQISISKKGKYPASTVFYRAKTVGIAHYQQSLALYKTDTCCRSLPLSIRL
jgi:hypothetical protein